MNSTLRRLLGWLLVAISSGTFCSAVCPGSLHRTSLAGYALSPDATRIAAIAHDGTLFWWDVASGKRTQLMECAKPDEFDVPILFSPDSARLAAVVYGAIHVYELPSGRLISQLTSVKLKDLTNMVFSGDGKRLAASHKEGVIVWDVCSGAEIMAIAGKINRKVLALNRDGNLLSLGHDGIEVWEVEKAELARKIQRAGAESLVFAHDDRWIIADISTALPVKDAKQGFLQFKHDLVIWDVHSGATVKSLSGPTQELRFPLAFVAPHTLLAVDYDYLRAWNLDSGELTETWETPSGHPSGDGKFLLRDGGAPGRLELWEIGSPDETARAFAYRSSLCAESFADGVKEVKFQGLAMFDGRNEDGGFWSGSSYVAQDCTPIASSHSKFKSQERAEQELQRQAALATEILEKRSVQKPLATVFLGERIVGRFANKHSSFDTMRIIWVEDNYVCEINSSSLPLALVMERQHLQANQKK
jgi:WD40 repeat protein